LIAFEKETSFILSPESRRFGAATMRRRRRRRRRRRG